MKDLKTKNHKPSITKKDIEEFENEANLKLTDEYKKFLLKYNGGRPETDCFDCLNIEDTMMDSCINGFHAIYDGQYNNLYNENRMYENRMPKGFIAIADDPCGNVICMGLESSGSECGKIYFWDHEEEVDRGEEPHFDNMYLLANNLTDFINGLHTLDLGRDEWGGYINIHTYDKYALPFSYHTRKYKVINDFFSNAPREVENYVVKEYQGKKYLDIYYDVASENKRYKRYVREDQTYADTVEDIQ